MLAYLPCTSSLTVLHLTQSRHIVKHLFCQTATSQANISISSSTWSVLARLGLLHPTRLSTSYASSKSVLHSSRSASCWQRKRSWAGSPLEQASLRFYHPQIPYPISSLSSTLLQTSLQYCPHTSLTMDESTFPVTPNAVAVPILALITLIIDTPPLVWHVRNRNLAASSLVFWVIISNLMNFINPLIWPTDDIQHWWHGQILCDIEIKLMMAVNFGVVGSMACVMRNLAKALDTEHTILSPSKAQRRTQITINCLFCFGGSIYVMLIHYIVQPNRYFIFAIAGCTSSFDNSWPSLVLVFIWPPIICLVDAYYSGMWILHPWVFIELKFPSSGHHPNAQIPQKFLGNPRIVKFQSDKKSVPTPVSAVNSTHSHLHPSSILRPLRQLGRASAPIQLGPDS